MRLNFWLGTYAVQPPVRGTASLAEPMLASDVSAVAIEVIRYADAGNLAVLLSTLPDARVPTQLTCRIGFANGARASNDWRDRGFPLVDAAIELLDHGTLVVTSPFFGQASQMQYDQELLRIEGVRFDAKGAASKSFYSLYDQSIDAPDYLSPAKSILRKSVCWQLERSQVKRPGKLTLKFKQPIDKVRSPDLKPVDGSHLVAAWSGVCEIPDTSVPERASPRRLSRADTFGVPAFRFDDVEIVGFRIELDAIVDSYEEKLKALIEPLNFHLDLDARAGDPEAQRRSPITDFRYVPATSTLIVELLRYGKMRLQTQSLPLNIDDFQSQHELLVRVLVGRVDDDTVQARDPAVFVPAIFVDNPWSKILGREVQGFDKHMASFCAPKDGLQPLRPDGRFAGEEKQRELLAIRRIDLVDTYGLQGKAKGTPLLALGYPERAGQRDAFEDIDVELALSGSSLSLTRWRQSDFGDPEFRRSFARSAVKQTLKGFRSIQVAPVGARVTALEKTWVTGSFVVDDTVRIARPSGVANLTLHNQSTAPTGWRGVCDLLGIAENGSGTLSFPAGSWYRMECAMNLLIDDGLA